MSSRNLQPMMAGLSGCYYKPIGAPPQSNTKGLTQGLHSTSVPDVNISAYKKAVLGSRWAPIEIADDDDSPIRENAPYQHHQTQRTKRARDENNSDAELYSNPSNKTKKAKTMHDQPQNHIIHISQNERELPTLQIDLNIPISLDNDIQFEQSSDDFFYEGESIHDFIGMRDYKVQDELGADGFSCHEITVDDFIGVEEFGVQEITSDDGCCYEKGIISEDLRALLESLDFNCLEEYFEGLPESLEDLLSKENLEDLI